MILGLSKHISIFTESLGWEMYLCLFILYDLFVLLFHSSSYYPFIWLGYTSTVMSFYSSNLGLGSSIFKVMNVRSGRERKHG